MEEADKVLRHVRSRTYEEDGTLRKGTRDVTRVNGPVSRVTQETIDRTLLMHEMKERIAPVHAIWFRDTGPKPNHFAVGYLLDVGYLQHKSLLS
jgi:hypothetical protein